MLQREQCKMLVIMQFEWELRIMRIYDTYYLF